MSATKSPVYEVKAVPIEKVLANDYNPNVVAPPEMKLLELSIWEDGFTMPCVCGAENFQAHLPARKRTASNRGHRERYFQPHEFNHSAQPCTWHSQHRIDVPHCSRTG